MTTAFSHFFLLVMCRPCSASVDQPEEVNMTAEEDVEDGTQVPDIRTFSGSAEESHLYAEPVNGTADLSPVGMFDLKFSMAFSQKWRQLCSLDEELPPIKHGESITDRRSTFQPHLAPVVSPRQVNHPLLLCG